MESSYDLSVRKIRIKSYRKLQAKKNVFNYGTTTSKPSSTFHIHNVSRLYSKMR